MLRYTTDPHASAQIRVYAARWDEAMEPHCEYLRRIRFSTRCILLSLCAHSTGPIAESPPVFLLRASSPGNSPLTAATLITLPALGEHTIRLAADAWRFHAGEEICLSLTPFSAHVCITLALTVHDLPAMIPRYDYDYDDMPCENLP